MKRRCFKKCSMMKLRAYKIIKAKTIYKSLKIHPYRLFCLTRLVTESYSYSIPDKSFKIK